MSTRLIALMTAMLVAADVASMTGAATAAPVVDPLALKSAIASNVENVWWRRGPGWGWGLGAGLLGGAIIGGALAAPYYYGYGPYYPAPYYGPGPYEGYPAPAPAYGPGPGPGGDAYCAQKYRSYDPATGTFMGKDGVRHPCR